MAILTDGPHLEAADKWTSATLAQIEAAHQHQMWVNAGLVLALIGLLVLAWFAAPLLWRRATAALSGPARLAEPERLIRQSGNRFSPKERP